jgi:hypothetical protein
MPAEPPGIYRRRGARRCRRAPQNRCQTGQEWRSAGHRAAGSVTAMDIAIHAGFLPHDARQVNLRLPVRF